MASGCPTSDGVSCKSESSQETSTKSPSRSVHSETFHTGSSNVIRRTPNAYTAESFPSSDPPPASSLQHHPTTIARQAHRAAAAVVGTPSAVGAIRLRKSSTLSQFMTPLPIRGSPLAAQDSVVSKSVHKSTSDQEESTDVEQMEFETEDARLVLEVARSRRAVCPSQLEQELAEVKSEENLALCNLYKHRAKEAGRLLASAETDIGFIRNSLRNAGITYQITDGSHVAKRRRLSFSTQGSSSPIGANIRPAFYTASPEV